MISSLAKGRTETPQTRKMPAPAGPAGWVTLTVFALCWLVFIASLFGISSTTFKFYSNLSWESFIDSPMRILGPAFFHYSWLHIVFNTMWWWQLGGSVERILGKGTPAAEAVKSSARTSRYQICPNGSTKCERFI